MIEAIRAELAARANPAKAEGMRAYMKSAMPFLGVQKPGREEIARAVFAAHPLEGFDEWRDTVLLLWREATYREERYLAIRLARDRRYREHRTMAALPLYEELIVTGAWWDFVDEVAVRLLGELLGDDTAPAQVLRRWATSEDMWKRRDRDHLPGPAQARHRPALCSTTASSRTARTASSSSARASAGRCARTPGSTPTRSCAIARRTSSAR